MTHNQQSHLKAKRKKRKQQARILKTAIFAVLITLIVVYVGFAFYFKHHFFPKTSIDDIKVGGKTTEQVIDKLSTNAEEYLLTLYDRKGDKYQINGSDISTKYHSTGEEETFLASQDVFLWPIQFLKNHTYHLDSSIEYDASALESQLLSLAFMQNDQMEAPENACIVASSDGYTVQEEVPGTTVLKDNVISEVSTAVEHQISELTLSDSCYEAPEITTKSDIFTAALSKIDSYMAATIDYTIEGVDESLSSGEIFQLLTISDDYEVNIDTDRVAAYIQKLATKYNTYGDERSFKTTLGDTVTIGGGDYGWVISKSEEQAEILADLEAGEPVTREPKWEQTAVQLAFKDDGTPDDIGNTYLEIDYTNQHFYYYKDGELQMDSDIVSGKISNGNGSPDGIFKIVYKQSPATLVGEDYQSDVQYFMPFAYNVGFHDASWRSSFGGSIYINSGSHGCVNLPATTAKNLYSMVEKGTPVVAYYRNSVKLTSNSSKTSNAYSYYDANAEKNQ